MATKTIYGRVTESNGTPVEFATVFVSNSSGNPLYSNKNTQTDGQGRFKLDGVGDNEYVSAQYTGLKKETKAASSAIPYPVDMAMGLTMPFIGFTLKPSEGAILNEVKIVAKKISQPKFLVPIVIVSALWIGAVALTRYKLKH